MFCAVVDKLAKERTSRKRVIIFFIIKDCRLIVLVQTLQHDAFLTVIVALLKEKHSIIFSDHVHRLPVNEILG